MSKKAEPPRPIVERTRTHYARSDGDPQLYRVDVLGVDLELPTSYARDLLVDLRRGMVGVADFEGAHIKLDVPVILFLRRSQVEELVEALAKRLRA